ncbi:uncharacterized protein [Amphiura filiformis]|uniref:uncharacterized protein n=1 Tax=Amphiura filiformis TaxID=82378 RepID=UPI003B20D159
MEVNTEHRSNFSRDGDSWRNTVPPDILPLYDATIQKDRRLVKKILDSNAIDINQTYGVWAETCLHIAVYQDDLKMCLLLLANGASTYSTDKWGRTALHTASSRGNIRICEELLKVGAPFLAKDKGGWTPLHMSSSYGHRNICQLLIRAGCDIHARQM